MQHTRERLRIEGRVQGVGFRWWTRQRAREAGLRGTVRNLEDGAVEVEVCGAGAAVAAFRTALEHGPSGARVERVASLSVGDGPLPDGFEIRR